jgi:hypothetical protein
MRVSRLKMERVARGWRQKDVEKNSAGAILQERYSQIERGWPCKPDEQIVLAHIFGVDVVELFPEQQIEK